MASNAESRLLRLAVGAGALFSGCSSPPPNHSPPSAPPDPPAAAPWHPGDAGAGDSSPADADAAGAADASDAAAPHVVRSQVSFEISSAARAEDACKGAAQFEGVAELANVCISQSQADVRLLFESGCHSPSRSTLDAKVLRSDLGPSSAKLEYEFIETFNPKWHPGMPILTVCSTVAGRIVLPLVAGEYVLRVNDTCLPFVVAPAIRPQPDTSRAAVKSTCWNEPAIPSSAAPQG